MSQSEKPFSVSDRRHFTPEGRPRDESEPEPLAASASGPPPTATPAAEPAGEPRDAVRGAPAAGPVSLGQFLLSLGAQAGMLLSAAGQPEGGDARESLEGARSIISILEMLHDKTQGRRTPEEDRVIDGLLFELRMAYLERSRAGKP